MAEAEMMKVYELAKELGLDSISLLDKLNDLNIKVKNHMSDLGDEDVRIARTSLGKKTATIAHKKAAPRTRKKAGETAAAAATEAHVEKKSASPIIRRRVKSDGETETLIPPSVAPGKATPHEHPSETETHEQEATQAHAHEETREEQQSVETTETVQAQEIAEATEAAQTPAEAEKASEAEQATAAQETAVPAPIVETPTAAPQQPPVRTRPPIVLAPRPVAPRRSILKIVEAAPPPPRPMIKPAATATPAAKAPVKGTSTQDKDGFRIIKMTKENLDQMVEEEAAKKRGGGREVELRPEDVRFADYRKKEMVFLPKKKKIPLGKEIRRTQITTPKAIKRIVEMQEAISIQDLANQLNVKAIDVVRKLMGMGQMATINQSVDFDTASLVAAEYQYEVKNVAFKEDALLDTSEDTAELLKPRPPVVTIMGHVDHGKTSLLDAIRETDVAGGEFGGITQHIGASTVRKDGKQITFIDTPGHEAFTVMRARGANVTDIVVLVVAADDGVMPQTREALSHAQAAQVPIIVAVNKIDKPGANPEKIKQVLAELNLLAEDWGGQTMFVNVSAIKKTNIDKLLEAILLQAEMLDLKANSESRASGTVLEARLEKGRGSVVSVLVNRGTLRVGDPIVSSCCAGKVKAMMDDKGKVVKEVGPGSAVEVLGFEGVPDGGERFDSPAADNDARRIAENRINKNREKAAMPQGKITLDALFAKIQSGSLKELSLVLKADVFGSVEAVRDSLLKLSNEKIKVNVIFSGAGGITESDVMLASASGAIIIGFNVRPETKARQLAESEHVEIKCYNIIYELLDDVKLSMVGLLDKKKVEKFLGRAEVRQTFSVPKIGVIAGSSVIDGKIVRGANLRLLRDSRIIFEGKMSSLKRFKDDAKEVATGFECGIGIENYTDIKPGDVIEAYQIELVTPELNS